MQFCDHVAFFRDHGGSIYGIKWKSLHIRTGKFQESQLKLNMLTLTRCCEKEKINFELTSEALLTFCCASKYMYRTALYGVYVVRCVQCGLAAYSGGRRTVTVWYRSGMTWGVQGHDANAIDVLRRASLHTRKSTTTWPGRRHK